MDLYLVPLSCSKSVLYTLLLVPNAGQWPEWELPTIRGVKKKCCTTTYVDVCTNIETTLGCGSSAMVGWAVEQVTVDIDVDVDV